MKKEKEKLSKYNKNYYYSKIIWRIVIVMSLILIVKIINNTIHNNKFVKVSYSQKKKYNY